MAKKARAEGLLATEIARDLTIKVLSEQFPTLSTSYADDIGKTVGALYNAILETITEQPE